MESCKFYRFYVKESVLVFGYICKLNQFDLFLLCFSVVKDRFGTFSLLLLASRDFIERLLFEPLSSLLEKSSEELEEDDSVGVNERETDCSSYLFPIS